MKHRPLHTSHEHCEHFYVYLKFSVGLDYIQKALQRLTTILVESICTHSLLLL
jgi:hypothetical protein